MFLFLLCHDDQSSSNNIDNYKACIGQCFVCLGAVGLDSEKRIFSEKMRKKRGKEAKK